MRNLIAFVLVSSASIAAVASSNEPIMGTMKQPYLYCTSEKTDNLLILENAAMGAATGIQLMSAKNGEYKVLAQRSITNIEALFTVALPGHRAYEYVGVGFKAQHSIINDRANFFRKNKVNLSIKLGSRILKDSFNCSTVE